MLSLTLEYPLKKHVISQPFGEDNTNDPIKKDFYKLFDNKHSGVDFPANVGTQVFSCLPGIVVRKEFHKGMGNVLGLRYGNIVTLYAHLSKFKAKLGQIVKKGQIIGLSGNSGGATTKPHLHLELRDITKPSLKGMVFDPPFGKDLKIKEFFIYKINNKNTQKSLKFLSLGYFGTEKYWRKIWLFNQKLPKDPKFVIPENNIVVIPNYGKVVNKKRG